MNVPFRLRDESLDAKFLEGAEASAACRSSRATARSAACARRSTTRCRSRACSALCDYLDEFASATARPHGRHFRILTLNQISPQGLHRFPAERYAVGKALDEPDAILVRSHDLLATPDSRRA